VRREPDHFGDRELDLIFIAKRLKDALRLEEILTAASVDYAVEVDQYLGGVIFKKERTGAFFYVLPEDLDRAKTAMRQQGFSPAAT
jgi:hypothetical protein